MKSTRESKMKENINFSKIKFKTYSINMLYIILIYIHGIFLKSWFQKSEQKLVYKNVD